MRRVLRYLAVLAVLCGVAVGGYAWLQSREPDDHGLTLVAVARGDITEKAVAVGQIEPRLKFKIKSKISGIVRRCAVDVGDRVRAGDTLFEITPDPTPSEIVAAERAVESAKSTFRKAEADWNRARELFAQGIIAQDILDARRESFEQARIDAGKAEDQFQLLRKGRIDGRGKDLESIVRAPADGIVLTRAVDPGDPVVPLTSYQEGTEMAQLADMSDLIFRGTVDEIDVGKLRVGLPARLKIGALPDAVVTGKVTRIAPQAIEKDNAKLFEVEIELDPAEDVALRAGFSANADVVIREKTGVLVLPERLVKFEDDGKRTFVELPPKAPDGEPVKHEIATGLSDGLSIEVTGGLEEGAKVVQRPPRDIIG